MLEVHFWKGNISTAPILLESRPTQNRLDRGLKTDMMMMTMPKVYNAFNSFDLLILFLFSDGTVAAEVPQGILVYM